MKILQKVLGDYVDRGYSISFWCVWVADYRIVYVHIYIYRHADCSAEY